MQNEKETLFLIPPYKIMFFYLAIGIFSAAFFVMGIYSLSDGRFATGVPLFLLGVLAGYGAFQIYRNRANRWQLILREKYMVCRPFNICYNSRGGNVSLLDMYITEKERHVEYRDIHLT